MRTATARLAPVLLLAGCNGYELFNVAGYEQASFSNEADILFIIDNSSSMADEATALATNFDSFIENLTNPEEGDAFVTEDLSDAVDNYVDYVTYRGRYIDYQLAITTTTMDYATEGPTSGVDPGEAGLLLGDPTVIDSDETDISGAFTRNLLCEATCWSSSAIEDDPGYECGADPGGVISEQYLDCVCGEDEWRSHCGSGTEEHLESALQALCRAVESPPEVCYDSLVPFSSGDIGSNPGMLRPDATTVIVIISDEGDTSRRMENGQDDPEFYLEAFDAFDRNIRFAVVGPPYDTDANALVCNSGGATSWGTDRLIAMAEESSGFYNWIAEDGDGDYTTTDDCAVSDFSVHLNDLGQLLGALTNVFELRSIPDETTIRVYVDGEPIAESDLVEGDIAGDFSYTDGWSYEPGQNAVVFWGEAVPSYNAVVRIYYRPLEGRPRTLPF